MFRASSSCQQLGYIHGNKGQNQVTRSHHFSYHANILSTNCLKYSVDKLFYVNRQIIARKITGTGYY